MIARRAAAAIRALILSALVLPVVAAPGGHAAIRTEDLKEWLEYIASDELAGRGTYSAGLGLAAAYIQDHLRAWNVKPAGDAGSYLQTVKVLGVKSTNRSSVTVRVGRNTRTFADGAGVTFPKYVGGARTFTIDRVQFAGYGLDVAASNHMDYRGIDVKDAAAVWLGARGPTTVDADVYRRVLSGRTRYATEQLGAAASIGPQAPPPDRPAGATPATAPAVDFTTAQRLDAAVPPAVGAGDEFLTFLFSAAPVSYSELKTKAEKREPLPSFRLDGVTLTFNVDASYEIVRTQLTHNVVGVIDGTDPLLKDSFVAFGAHYDHVGYAENDPSNTGPRRGLVPGRINDPLDRIWNGADDDGSGTVAVLALAKAFAEAPPKRSLLFVWHAGEERGLLGSRYYADYPTVPVDRIVTQLNIDMIGRNRDDKPSEADTVYLVGSDRISSELHEINREANAALAEPLTLDYELNDPADLEQIYYRSDHYSYAAKGIPVIFFTTGLHKDYHANTDEVSRIEWEKLTRITQLVYETGARVANRAQAPARDNQGPRAGKATR